DGLSAPVGWLAVAAIALSAVGLYYYLVVLKQALVAPPARTAGRITVPKDVAFVLVICALLLLLLGLFPSFVLRVFTV
ncbi:MAG TPA: NADH-quinone oxidoreductase subunit N, partial [Opitutus sp.]|nr:NADH-quinone oxidoreductase subunit N [Opitutus sp.]